MRLIILYGGSRSRLWPLSKSSLPKKFISIFNGEALLDLIIKRVIQLALKKKPIFICNKIHGFLLIGLLAKLGNNICY